MKVTDYQIELMKHTVGDGSRNFFGTCLGNKDSNAFAELVEMGLATSTPAPDWMGDDVIYRLTEPGAVMAHGS